MISKRVNYEIEQLRQITTYEGKLAYLKTLPKGMAARVVGAILDRAKYILSAERSTSEEDRYRKDLARHLRNEERAIRNPFAVPYDLHC